MAKVRISALAKDLKVSSEALVQLIRATGENVKSHSSTVDESLKETLKKQLDEQRAAIKEKYASKESRLSRRRGERPSRRKKPEGAEATADKPAGAAEKPAKKNEERAPRKSDDRPARPARPRNNDDRPQRGPRREDRAPRGRRPEPVDPNYVPPTLTRDERNKRIYVTAAGAAAPQRQQRDDRGGRPSFNRDNRSGSSVIDPNSSFAKEMADKQAGLKTAEDGTKKKAPNKKKGKKDKYKKKEVSEVEMKANIKKTLAKIGAGSTKKKYKKMDREEEVVEGEIKDLQVSEFISVGDLAQMIDEVSVSELIAKCLELGLFVTINQRLDFDTIELLAEEFGYKAILMEEYAEELEEEEEDDRPLEPRAPVVTVMGHVDHGKTSLLDYIRKANIAGGEAGGITQHIASYEVQTKNGKVTFLDTPGHEAFAAMRARGSQITDVVVLIVAADSAVMPQTKEAIDHTKAAGVPMVIAVNKVDLPTANVQKIYADLAQYDVLVEPYGGQIPAIEISAKTGAGIDDLLEILALETELLELKAPVIGDAKGVIIESELDKGRGAIATVLMQKGRLNKGDCFVTGSHSGRVREMFNDRGKKINKAGPAQPVMVLGLTGTPQAGDSFRVVDNDKIAREIAGKRRLAEKEREIRQMNVVSLDNFFETIQEGQIQTMNIIVKGDVDGSVEALAASLEKLSNDEIKVNIIHKSVGGVKESDIMLAQASKAIIVGFHINPNPKIREHAREAGIDIRTYRIIYEVVDDVKAAMIGMLIPEKKEEILGSAEVREIFKVSKLGQIAGCMVTSGKIARDCRVRLIRDDIELHDTVFTSLQRFKDQAKEVVEGFDCGIMLKGVPSYKVGDRIECYTEVEIKRTELKAKKTEEEKAIEKAKIAEKAAEKKATEEAN